MSTLDAIIERSILAGIDAAIAPTIKAAVDGSLDKTIEITLQHVFRDPRYPFLAGGQTWLMEGGMDGWAAWQAMRDQTAQYLKDEKMAFGQSGFDWDFAAGRELAQELFADR